MKKDFIDYGERINKALLQVIKDILLDLSKDKISSNHCFYITFNTNHKASLISQKLKKEYPKEMTIVIQNQFWDLEVNKSSFSITLSFNRKRETLIIPYESISKFNDPFVKFSLQLDFKVNQRETITSNTKKSKDNQKDINKIISLSSFRKKKD